ncbi:hypothetical protein I545_0101 [Mycobacterium kansasii 662]|uniref:Uncharacterized protein n=2 Tax=Mycobacterium kansasii TaxID=1768 RepID=A0A1V3WK28_MYCKA|nr:hypothetical protein I547_1347 [Mycobacterium kansasii 824]EUA20747.1 hypothetical protein I545_0101 [Mycobacterium kansasii 662]KEP43689.1 hypothetical protein MKSMC1_10530 [Mycobacterium kansasii]OOK67275.1 hypothetical protein BZL30_7856 [Mycobacterium kansasii]OOK83368.1 hypothetical protein BZL29_0103 [Mycobacterium kansasii]
MESGRIAQLFLQIPSSDVFVRLTSRFVVFGSVLPATRLTSAA